MEYMEYLVNNIVAYSLGLAIFLLLLGSYIIKHDPRTSFRMTPNMLEINDGMGSMIVIKQEIVDWCKEHKIRFKEYLDHDAGQRKIRILNIIKNKELATMFYLQWGG